LIAVHPCLIAGFCTARQFLPPQQEKNLQKYPTCDDPGLQQEMIGCFINTKSSEFLLPSAVVCPVATAIEQIATPARQNQ